MKGDIHQLTCIYLKKFSVFNMGLKLCFQNLQPNPRYHLYVVLFFISVLEV